MDLQRNLLVIALLFVSLIIWQSWQIEFASKATIENTQKIISNITTNSNILKVKDQKSINFNNEQGKLITVKTDVLLLKINTRGGDIEQAFLLSYPEKLGSAKPFHLLETSSNFIYQAQSGLIGKNDLDLSNKNRYLFTSKKEYYVLADNMSELHIPLIYNSPDGIIYKKTFFLTRSNFKLNIEHHITNNSKQPIELKLINQLKQSFDLPKNKNFNNNYVLHSYRGAAYSTFEKKYHKYSFENIKTQDLSISSAEGWVAMLQQYFATAWISCIPGKKIFFSRYLPKTKLVIIGIQSTPIKITDGKQINLNSILWLGPEIQDKMAATAPYLDLVVDYGWLWFISQPLFKLLTLIHSYIGNWGISIIIITLIVRIIMYPLTKAQYTSITKMRMLQPKIILIRERLGISKQQQNKEIMALYKAEKVNPLGGCLPVLIQMPIFLALYYTLSSSIELRHAPFILWINDLSAQDPYYILPIIMGISLFTIQKMSNTTNTDLIQQKIMILMPVIFTVFFLWFPSGLVLYYIISNLVTIVQQKILS